MTKKLLSTLFIISVLITRSYSQCAEAVINYGGDEIVTCGNMLSVRAENLPSGYDYNWSALTAGIEIVSADGSSASVKNDNGGLLVYTISDSVNGCISSDTVLIRKTEEFKIFGNSVACKSDSNYYYAPISYEATNSDPVYTWKINGKVKSDSIILYDKFNPDDQIVLVLEIPGCGTFYDTLNLDPASIPTVALGNDTSATICPGKTLTFRPTLSLGETYELNWYLDSLKISQDSVLTIGRNLAPGTYNLKITGISTDRCVNHGEVNDEIELTVGANLNLQIQSDYGDTICPGVSTYLTTNGFTDGAYVWYRNDSVVSTQSVIETKSKGNYKVDLISMAGCRYSSEVLVLEIKEYPQQKLTLSPGSYVCEGSTTRLTAETEFYHEWSFEGEIIGPSDISAKKPGWYSVTYYDDCSFTDSVYIESRPAYVDSITLSAVWVEDDNLEVRARNVEKAGTSSWEFDGGGVQIDSLLLIYSYFPGLNTITFYTETSCGLLVRTIDVTIGDSIALYSINGPSVLTSSESYTFAAPCIPGAKYKWYVPAGFKINSGADSCVINISSASTSSLRFQPGENEICVERTDKEPAVMCKSLEIITSAVEKNAAVFNVFPNPFENNFTVSDKSVNKNYRIRILDVAGKILSDANLVPEANYGDDLKQGVYFIQIYNVESSYSYKLMKN